MDPQTYPLYLGQRWAGNWRAWEVEIFLVVGWVMGVPQVVRADYASPTGPEAREPFTPRGRIPDWVYSTDPEQLSKYLKGKAKRPW